MPKLSLSHLTQEVLHMRFAIVFIGALAFSGCSAEKVLSDKGACGDTCRSASDCAVGCNSCRKKNASDTSNTCQQPLVARAGDTVLASK